MENKVCAKCVMDETDSGISFDNYGVCNYCNEHEKIKHNYIFTNEEEEENLKSLSELIIKNKNGKYDCILGLSGGVDSSYLAILAHKMNLKPLCVHFDNGWNSEIAVSNIQTVVKKFNFDLITYVINWDEFRDLQRSFIKANVIDLEMLSDHAIFAALFKIRKKYKIKYVLSGTNFATEFGLPLSWIWSKMDWKNIKSIHKKFGSVKLNTYPRMSGFRWALISKFGFGGVFLELLNKVNYSKTKALKELKTIGWQEYGGKHYE
jgi:N-acetyl sugar amidotransferase